MTIKELKEKLALLNDGTLIVVDEGDWIVDIDNIEKVLIEKTVVPNEYYEVYGDDSKKDSFEAYKITLK